MRHHRVSGLSGFLTLRSAPPPLRSARPLPGVCGQSPDPDPDSDPDSDPDPDSDSDPDPDPDPDPDSDPDAGSDADSRSLLCSTWNIPSSVLHVKHPDHATPDVPRETPASLGPNWPSPLHLYIRCA